MTSFSSSPLGKLPRTVSRLLAVLIGLALAVAGLLFMVGALVVGLLAAAGLTLWALLRGRRPVAMGFRWGGPGFRRPPPPASGEVVDVEMRELPEPPRARD